MLVFVPFSILITLIIFPISIIKIRSLFVSMIAFAWTQESNSPDVRLRRQSGPRQRCSWAPADQALLALRLQAVGLAGSLVVLFFVGWEGVDVRLGWGGARWSLPR